MRSGWNIQGRGNWTLWLFFTPPNPGPPFPSNTPPGCALRKSLLGSEKSGRTEYLIFHLMASMFVQGEYLFVDCAW